MSLGRASSRFEGFDNEIIDIRFCPNSILWKSCMDSCGLRRGTLRSDRFRESILEYSVAANE
jgi:hypothetical protein